MQMLRVNSTLKQTGITIIEVRKVISEDLFNGDSALMQPVQSHARKPQIQKVIRQCRLHQKTFSQNKTYKIRGQIILRVCQGRMKE